MATNRDRILRKVFLASDRLSRRGLSICFWLLVFTAVAAMLWRVTDIALLRYVGPVLFLLALAGMTTAFAAQSTNQLVRHIARKNGRGSDFFKRDDRASVFNGAAKHLSDRRHTLALRPRTNARSHRRTSRPAFAHASNASATSEGGSGDSDSDGPREHRLPAVRFQHPAKQSNKELLREAIPAVGVRRLKGTSPWRRSVSVLLAYAGDRVASEGKTTL